jgi:hypothetical protein
MAFEASGNAADSLKNLMESVEKPGQMQVYLFTNGNRSAASAIETIYQEAVDSSGNAVKALNQALQNVSASIDPKNDSCPETERTLLQRDGLCSGARLYNNNRFDPCPVSMLRRNHLPME